MILRMELLYIGKRQYEVNIRLGKSRYDVGFSIRIDTLKKAVNELNEWYEGIKDQN